MTADRIYLLDILLVPLYLRCIVSTSVFPFVLPACTEMHVHTCLCVCTGFSSCFADLHDLSDYLESF